MSFLRGCSIAAARRSIPACFVLHRSRSIAALCAATLLCGCAGDGPIAGLAPPPSPEVPAVAPDAYPTLGTTQPGRPAPLNADQQKELEKDLESLAKRQQ